MQIELIEWLCCYHWKNHLQSQLSQGAAFSLIKETEVKAPRKIELLFPFGSHIVRISTMLSFRKPTNEKRLLNMSGSCQCSAVGVILQLLWQWSSGLRLQGWMETKPFIWELRLAKGNNLLIQAVQEGHVSSPCLFIPSPGWTENPNSTQMY